MPPRPDGRRRQLRRGGFSSQQAARQARDYLSNPGSNDPSPALITTAQWLQLWLDTRLGPGESTLRSYRQHIHAYLIPYLGGRMLKELTNAHIQAMFTAIIRTHGAAGRPVTAETLQRPRHPARRAERRCPARADRAQPRPLRRTLPRTTTARRRLDTTPHRPMARHRRTPRVAVWTAAQTATFLHSIRDHRLYLLFHLVALLGLRRGEVIGLQWRDVDLDAGYLTVSHQIRQVGATIEVGKPKSEASNRVIALDHTTLTLLRRHHDACRDPLLGAPVGYLSLNALGRPIRPDALTSLSAC